MAGKFKKQTGHSGAHIKPTEDKTPDFDIFYPVFCLRYLNKDYHLDKCEVTQKVKFIERLCMLSSLTWEELRLAPRHGLGAEKIAQNSIKAGIPQHLTKDEIFYAYRFDGKKPIVGYRNKFVFHVVYIDRDFSLYNHK